MPPTDFSPSEARSRFVAIDEYRIEMLTFMGDYDAIVCPAMPTAAKPHHHGLVEINDFSHMMVHNLTGWPAAVVRCGTSTEGLPVGVQIVARPWHDGRIESKPCALDSSSRKAGDSTWSTSPPQASGG